VQYEQWTPAYKASMVSAISGGQWTQSRLASVRGWTDDSLCQLCRAEVGTVAHRRCCPAIMPVGGWPLPLKDASVFCAQLEVSRRNLALDRGLLVAQIIVPPAPVEESFQWFLPPPPTYLLGQGGTLMDL
jgi:hypothetical protein